MTPAQKLWVADMENAIVQSLSPLLPEGQRLIVAHGAFESGWGKSKAFTRGYNFGNLTAGKFWQGKKWVDRGGDTEYDKDGKVRTISQEWRIYSDLDDAIIDYWEFLGRPRYVKARDFLAKGDAFNFCVELSKGGYYTLPCAKYFEGLNGVLKLL